MYLHMLYNYQCVLKMTEEVLHAKLALCVLGLKKSIDKKQL